MTIDQYEKAKKIISTIERINTEIKKLERTDSIRYPYGTLVINTDTVSDIRISLNTDMMRQCIDKVYDMYQELYEAKQKELEAL